MVPTSLVAVSELPKNENNKIDRALLKPIAETGVSATPPRDEWERSVAEVWCSVLGLDSVSVEERVSFPRVGTHLRCWSSSRQWPTNTTSRSTHQTSLSAQPSESLRKGPGSHRWPTEECSFLCVVAGAGPPLFCFAGAGGLAGTFLHLARHLDRPVYGLQARGLEGGGLPDWTQRDWVVRCIREIRRIQPHGPYYLAGHSFGGLLAWEAAQLLKDDGEEVALLVLIDTLYPTSPALGTHMDGAERDSDITRIGRARQSLRRPVRTVALFAMINVAGFLPMRWTKAEPLFRLRRDAPMAISAFSMGWPDRDLPGRVQTRQR